MELEEEIKYDKIDPEEIIIKLKEILKFIQNKKKAEKYEQKLPDSFLY